MTIKERSSLTIIIGIILSLILVLSNNFLSSYDETTKNYKIPSLFNEIITQIESEYIDEVDHDVLINSAVTGILSDLDEYSEILSNEDYRQVRNSAEGVYSGIGVTLYKHDGHTKIASVITNSVAFHAGIETDDEIIQIDSDRVATNNLSYISNQLDGEIGSEVILLLRKSTDKKIIQIPLVREQILIPSVYSEVLASSFCYIKLDKFNNKTKLEIVNIVSNNCLSSSASDSSIKGFIVDIRNNPGGTLESAVGVSDLFLDSGVIVSAKGRNNDLIFIHSANKTDILKGLPIAVIVNQYSASASEIFAGALQDNNRAILVGTATYGKGSIQSVIPLSDGGAIKLTTARYIRPSGAPINKLGIRPDILVKSSNSEEFSLTKRKDDHSNDIQLSEAINALNNNINYYH